MITPITTLMAEMKLQPYIIPVWLESCKFILLIVLIFVQPQLRVCKDKFST